MLCTKGPQLILSYQDECKTDGWNDDGPREYGQIKPVNLADQVVCVTADESASHGPQHTLSVADCSDYNGGILNQQWFYANYVSDGDLTPRVELTLEGNPANPSDLTTFGSTDGIVGVQPLNSPSPLSVALFDVTISS